MPHLLRQFFKSSPVMILLYDHWSCLSTKKIKEVNFLHTKGVPPPSATMAGEQPDTPPLHLPGPRGYALDASHGHARLRPGVHHAATAPPRLSLAPRLSLTPRHAWRIFRPGKANPRIKGGPPWSNMIATEIFSNIHRGARAADPPLKSGGRAYPPSWRFSCGRFP
jgi:hypothetical protein